VLLPIQEIGVYGLKGASSVFEGAGEQFYALKKLSKGGKRPFKILAAYILAVKRRVVVVVICFVQVC
jgi:hypothetical protein